MTLRKTMFMFFGFALFAFIAAGLSSCGSGDSGFDGNYMGFTSGGSEMTFSLDGTVLKYNTGSSAGIIDISKSSCLSDLYYYIDSNITEPTYSFFSTNVGLAKINNAVLFGFSNVYVPSNVMGSYTYLTKTRAFVGLNLIDITNNDGTHTQTWSNNKGDGGYWESVGNYISLYDSKNKHVMDIMFHGNAILVKDSSGIGVGLKDGYGMQIGELKGKRFEYMYSSFAGSTFGVANITDVEGSVATGTYTEGSACPSNGGGLPSYDLEIDSIAGHSGWFTIYNEYTIFISKLGYFVGMNNGDFIVGSMY